MKKEGGEGGVWGVWWGEGEGGTKCKERKCNSHKKEKKSQIMIKKK